MFDVTIDPVNKRVVITIAAFLDIATIRSMEVEIVAGIAAIMRTSPHFDLLVALNGLGPASREVGEHMDAMLRRITASGLRRSANVGFGAIAKLQLQRLTGNDDRYRFFATTAEAETWLAG